MPGRIYGIENRITHDIYIGQTRQTIKQRFNRHRFRDSVIGRAIRKYGKENFWVVTLEECESPEELNAAEIAWIAKLNCKYPHGYNLTDGGKGGLNPSERTRALMAAAKLGRKRPPHSAETRAKISAANKGQIPWCKGQHHSESTKSKISAALKGHEVPDEVRKKISETLKARSEKK